MSKCWPFWLIISDFLLFDPILPILDILIPKFLDVLDAQRTLFQAKSQYIQVLLDAHQAIAEIESILGHVVTHPAQQEKE